MRFYYLTPQWDTTLQASNFLPDKFDAANAAQLYYAGVRRRSAGRRLRATRDGPELIGTATPTLANTVEERFIGRLTPGSNRFNGSFQAGQGINDQLQNGNAFRVSPRIGVVYDLTGKGQTIVRGGVGIFYDRPQGNQVFDMISNAPGVLNSRLAVRAAAGPRRRRAAIRTRRCRSIRPRTTSSRRRSTSGTSACSTS